MKLQNILVTLCIIILFLNSLIFSQQQKIIISVKADTIPHSSSILITGGGEQLGFWSIMQPMEKITDKTWKYEVSVNRGDTIQFKFTRGSWENEAVDSNGLEFPNFVHIVHRDTQLYYQIPNWRDLVQSKIILTEERIKNKGGWVELYEGWKYKIGDDTSWADPAFDDSDWKNINPNLKPGDFEKLEWTGNIWFRNEIYVDSSLWNIPFGFNFMCTGAAEIYLNGRLLYKYGKVGSSAETEETYFDRNPRHILFDRKESQVLAVRYSNHSSERLVSQNIQVGFTAILGDVEVLVYNRIDAVRELSITQMGFSAFILAFAIMHLLLFIFYPKAKENLFYSISMFSFAVVIYTSVQNNFITSILTILTLSTINSLSVQFSILFGLLTVYASSYEELPKQYKYFIAVSTLFLIQTFFFSQLSSEIADTAFFIYAGIITVEIVRSVFRSIKRKQEWSWGWLIGVGFIVAILFIGYQVLILTGIITRPLFGIYLVYVYGLVFLAITVSINLAKKMSDTHKNLEKQLVQVKELSQKTIEQEIRAKDEELARKLLEADNFRKTKELEEARILQHSMLPKSVPEISGLEISVYLKTASEVGGDYYDFKHGSNGELTVVVGDATGHGMKAGTMVATIKGLFSAESQNTDITDFLNKCSSIIKDMELGNLFMAMLIAKINGKRLSISSAGMPPALIYRSETKNVEEILLKALPLGGPSVAVYNKKEINLSSGDTVLLMSDGFPELFDKQKEILGYDKAKEIFGKVASLPGNQIISSLCKSAEDWHSGTRQEDDITFVVIKVKS
jgi:serine phosphatase RsbU (regulator of sigma subunit)